VFLLIYRFVCGFNLIHGTGTVKTLFLCVLITVYQKLGDHDLLAASTNTSADTVVILMWQHLLRLRVLPNLKELDLHLPPRRVPHCSSPARPSSVLEITSTLASLAPSLCLSSPSRTSCLPLQVPARGIYLIYMVPSRLIFVIEDIVWSRFLNMLQSF
jgi:hypothetical protein